MPTSFPLRETPKWRTWDWAMRSFASRSVLFSSIISTGADMICSTVALTGSSPPATHRRTISVSVRIPMISPPFVMNRLPMLWSRNCSAAVLTVVSRSTLRIFSTRRSPDVVVPQLFRRRFDCRVPIHPPDFLHRDHHRFNRHHAAPSSSSLLDPALDQTGRESQYLP